LVASFWLIKEVTDENDCAKITSMGK